QADLYRQHHTAASQRIGRVFKKALGKENVVAKRKHGLRKASVFDFHSLRTTWITEALSRGVPIETVKLISGHKTVEVVTTHYFHPNREHVRNALQDALPIHLTGSQPSGQQKMLPGPTPKVPIQCTPADHIEAALAALKGVTGKANRERVAKATKFIQAVRETLREPAIHQCSGK
ncbi:MAG: tyrosine-type recombinase/integrase, partial [Verrucomicrobia bacterium]|nr:tyrosine-type recombinase/integrase [Verrucomicrobiota bacterium]